MITKWIPEVPVPTTPALYRAREPHREGKMGERLVLVTANPAEALQFNTRADCMAWCDANPHPIFEPREHGFANLPA